MQLQQFLDRIEDPAKAVGPRIARQSFHVVVCQQIEVELRADRLDDPGEVDARATGMQLKLQRIEDGSQDRCVVKRTVGHVVGRHDRGNLRIGQDGANRVLERADNDRFVDELVFVASQATYVVNQRLPFGCRLNRHEQRLE